MSAVVTSSQVEVVRGLVWLGWSDLRIAMHTGLVVYRIARIRDRLGLPANAMRREVA